MTDTTLCWAAESYHPIAAAALGEVVGEIIDHLGDEPDLAVVVSRGAHSEMMQSALGALEAALRPRTAPLAVADRVANTEASLTLFAARFAPSPTGTSPSVDRPGVTLVMGDDPLTRPVHGGDLGSPAEVFGGLGPLGEKDAAAWATRIGRARGRLCPQWRPVGDPMVVTGVSADALTSLAGERATERLERLIGGLGDSGRLAARSGLMLGRLIDERLMDWSAADLVPTDVLGVRRSQGAVVVAEPIPLGAVVQFLVADPDTLETDLAAAATTLAPHGAAGAIVITDTPLPAIPRPGGIAASISVPVEAVIAPVAGATFVHRRAAALIVVGPTRHHRHDQRLG